MSKATISGVIHNSGYVVAEYIPETIVGSVLQIIEILGLQKTQEEALKSSVRSKIYDTFFQEYSGRTILIDVDLHQLLQDKNEANRKKANLDGEPNRGLNIEDIK